MPRANHSQGVTSVNNGKKVLAAGHICLDITPVFPAREGVDLGTLLAPGKLVEVGRPDIHLGGSVANTGLALRFFGQQVRLAAKIGQDAFGQLVRGSLGGCGCEVRLAEDVEAGTSYSIVIAVPGVDRLFLHDPGANVTFGEADLPEALLDGVGHFHFGYPPLMARMVAGDGEELARLFRRVKARGITTSLDMAAVDPHSVAARLDWRRILGRVLPDVDLFVPSVEEIGFMLDRKRYDDWNARARGGDITGVLAVDKDVEPLAAELMDLGAAAVMIKCGAPGLYYRAGSGANTRAFCQAQGLAEDGWLGKKGFQPGYRPWRVASATGAGDTCIAAFLAAMLEGESMEACARLAAAAGASCVTAYDALSGLLPLQELRGRIAAGWETVGTR